VDYIQASLWLSESTVIMKGFKSISPVRFYKRGYMHPNGFRLYFGNPNSKLAMVVASGETMQSLRNDQYLDAQILDWVLSQDGQVSRLDLAVTEYVESELILLEDIEKWYLQERIESPLAKYGCKTISSVSKDAGVERQTIYIGDIAKRGKRGIFRAYDKGVEMGIGNEMVTRLELELKRENAHATAKRLVESNDIAGNFRAKFNVKADEFNRLMEADAVTVTRGKNQAKEAEQDEINRRWDWLMKQVAPALKQAISDERKRGNGDTRLIAFMAEAGMLEDARKYATHLADAKYRDKLERNELVPRSSGKKEL
jgi:DNA relaxase NicK